jgi:hypothetical protein
VHPPKANDPAGKTRPSKHKHDHLSRYRTPTCAHVKQAL